MKLDAQAFEAELRERGLKLATFMTGKDLLKSANQTTAAYTKAHPPTKAKSSTSSSSTSSTSTKTASDPNYESKHPRGAGGLFIQSGSSGSLVTGLQSELGVKSDGDFGNQTEGAVKHFQKTHGLTVDGIVGHQTATALLDSQSGGTSTPAPTGELTTKDRASLTKYFKKEKKTAGKIV